MNPINAAAFCPKMSPSSQTPPNQIIPKTTTMPPSLFQPFSQTMLSVAAAAQFQQQIQSPPLSTTSSSSTNTFSPQAVGTTFRPCTICCGPSNGFYFGVLSCRACASFFRRSALEKRQYECRRGGQCEIRAEGMRNSCRACRLRTCIEAGMNIDMTTIPHSASSSIANSNSSSSSISTAITPSFNSPPNTITPCSSAEILHPSTSMSSMICPPVGKVSLDMSFDLSIPNILQMAQSLRNFQNGHKALVNVLIGRLDLSLNNTNEFRLITLEEHIQLDRGQITMMLNLLREYFPPIDGLSNETKVAILKCFHLQLCQIRNAEYAVQAFPGGEKIDKHLMHPGCGIDQNNLEHFFSTTESPEEHIRLCIPLLDRITAFATNRYRPLALNQLEFAALARLILYNNVDRIITLPPEFVAQRNVIYSELHALLAQRFNGNSGQIAIRFGQLMNLLLDLVNLTYEMEELFTILKIFLPPLSPCGDVWEDMLNAKGKGPTICERTTGRTGMARGKDSQNGNGRGGVEKYEENNIVDVVGH